MNESHEKIVYFVRHGQSEGNISPVFQASDSSLTELGRKQAKEIASRIAKLSFEALVSSPLTRAKETTEIIAKVTGKEPKYSDLFAECGKPTSVVGKPYADEKACALWKVWKKSLYAHGLRVEDGENYDDLIGRADKALDSLKNQKGDVVVVTHGFFLRTIVARAILGGALTPATFKNFQTHLQMENTGLTVLKYEYNENRYSEDGERFAWRLWIYNDHAHLAD